MNSPNPGDGFAQSGYANDALDIKEEYAPVDEDEDKSSTDDDNEEDNKSVEDTSGSEGSEKSNARKKDDFEVTIRPTPNDHSRKGKSNRKVPSMYDENLYALPDNEEETSINQTPTLRTSSPEQRPKPKRRYSERKFACIVLGMLFLSAGVGGAIYFSIFYNSSESDEGKCLTNDKSKGLINLKNYEFDILACKILHILKE